MAAAPIVLWGRWLVTAAAFAYSNWDEITSLFDRVEVDEAQPIFGYRYVAVIDQRDAAAGVWTERAQYSIAFVNVTGGDPDYTWTTADFQAIESGSEAFWTALASSIPSTFRLAEHRWYAFGPGVTPPNPVHRFVTLTTPIAGTAGVGTFSQGACAITLKTTLRKHWGRFYLPYSATRLDAAGRILTANVDAVATAARTFLTSGSGQGVFPCVYDSTKKVVNGMTAIQVDDIADIVRRRRQAVTQYRKVFTS